VAVLLKELAEDLLRITDWRTVDISAHYNGHGRVGFAIARDDSEQTKREHVHHLGLQAGM
jgi:hypothetical protein